MADFSLTKLMFPILIPIYSRFFVSLIPFNVFPLTASYAVGEKSHLVYRR